MPDLHILAQKGITLCSRACSCQLHGLAALLCHSAHRHLLNCFVAIVKTYHFAGHLDCGVLSQFLPLLGGSAPCALIRGFWRIFSGEEDEGGSGEQPADDGAHGRWSDFGRCASCRLGRVFFSANSLNFRNTCQHFWTVIGGGVSGVWTGVLSQGVLAEKGLQTVGGTLPQAGIGNPRGAAEYFVVGLFD